MLLVKLKPDSMLFVLPCMPDNNRGDHFCWHCTDFFLKMSSTNNSWLWFNSFILLLWFFKTCSNNHVFILWRIAASPKCPQRELLKGSASVWRKADKKGRAVHYDFSAVLILTLQGEKPLSGGHADVCPRLTDVKPTWNQTHWCSRSCLCVLENAEKRDSLVRLEQI